MILQNRTEKRQIGSRAGNSFSTATFAAPDVRLLPVTHLAVKLLDRLWWAALPSFKVERYNRKQVPRSSALCAMQISPAKTDREYWQRVMPEALAEHDKQVRHRTR